MPQISVCLHWQEGNYIIQLLTKLISVNTKLLRRCCDRMRYVLKHNDKKIFFILMLLCLYAYCCGYVDISGHLHLTQGRARLHPYVVVPLE